MFATEIEVRLMRRVQVKDYEPFEAAVGYRFVFEEGDDTQEGGFEAVRATKEMLAACFEKREATAAPEKGSTEVKTTGGAGKGKGGRKKKTEDAAPPTLPDAGGPDEAPAAAKEAPAAHKAAEQAEARSSRDLQTYAMSLIQATKLTPDYFKGTILAKYGATRSLDLKPEDVEKAWADLDGYIASKDAGAAKSPGDDLDI